MAKGKRSGGPGTYSENWVNCTMDAPFSKAQNQKTGSGGVYDHNKAPFDKAHDTGGGGISEKFFDNLGGKSAGPSQVGPSQQGQKREGTKEYPYGGGSMRDGRGKY